MKTLLEPLQDAMNALVRAVAASPLRVQMRLIAALHNLALLRDELRAEEGDGGGA